MLTPAIYRTTITHRRLAPVRHSFEYRSYSWCVDIDQLSTLQARVLGYVFNPISVFWCHDSAGALRHVIAEVHNTYGQRHAYLLPPANRPGLVTKRFYVSRCSMLNGVAFLG